MNDIKRQERKAYYTLIYQSGFYKQGSLFEVEDIDQERSRAFRKFIDREAKKRNVTPLELIDYFADHYNEFRQLLKANKKTFEKFPTIYKNSEMEKFTQELLTTQRPKNTGIEGGFGTWAGKGVQYLIPAEDLFKLKGKDPKVYVSQLKNLSLLLALVQEQQHDNEAKEPVCEFSRVLYARRRGRTEEQIQKGGKIFEEDRRDLITGAITTYRIDHIEINGKKYTRYGIPNFYVLDEPENPRDSWRVTFFNEPYRTFVTNLLHGKARPFFKESPKAIEDRYTDEHPYLFLFYLQLIKRKQSKSLLTWRIKVKDLFEDMKIDAQIIARPKECFELLRDCLIYFHEHYEPIPEIESFRLSKESQNAKGQTPPLKLGITEAFKNTYEDFKELLLTIGIKDIREAYIAFNRYPTSKRNKHKNFILTEADNELINEILTWAKDWEECAEGNEIPFTEKERYKFLSDCIRYLEHDKVEQSFHEEQSREKEGSGNSHYHVDDPIGYFTQRLPAMLKGDSETKAGGY